MYNIEKIIENSGTIIRKAGLAAAAGISALILTGCFYRQAIVNVPRGITTSFKPAAYHVSDRHSLELKANEHILPVDVLRVYNLISDPGLDPKKPEDWQDVHSRIGGAYIDRDYLPPHPLDFLDIVYSAREQFYDILSHDNSLTKGEIDEYYEILTTQGNIALSEKVTESTIFHERIHKYIEEELTSGEKKILRESSHNFTSWMYEPTIVDKERSIEFSRYLDRDVVVATAFASKYMSPSKGLAIACGNWSELYAHLASHQVYPQGEIQREVYREVKQRHPEAYEIYEKVVRNVLHKDR